MSLKGWQETLVTAQADGTALSSFTTAASILPSAARWTEPAGEVANIGKQYEIVAAGRLSNVVTAQPTFTWEFRMGPTSNIVAFTTGAFTCSTTVHTNVPWLLYLLLTVRSVGGGTAATFMGQATMHSQAFVASGATADGANTHTMLMGPNTAPAVGTGWDSTIGNIMDLYVGCSSSNAGNAVQLHQYSLRRLN